MDPFGYLAIFLILPCIIIFLSLPKVGRWSKMSVLMSWPVLWTRILCNLHRIPDFATQLLTDSGGTFVAKASWFSGLDMVVTSDPANIHYVLTKNFPNYQKGPDFRKLSDIWGDGFFTSDSELWEFHRRMILSFLNHPEFHGSLERAFWHKMEYGLLPVLDSFIEQGIEVDLQDILQRFGFDVISKLLLNYDPRCLSIDLPHIPCEKASHDVWEAILHRHLVPETIWKLQRLLGIGKEKKLQKAWHAFDEFIYRHLSLEEKDVENSKNGFNFFSAIREACKEKSASREFLKDTFVNLLFAGRDTTSTAVTWLLWLVATNPSVQRKIRDEIRAKLYDDKRIFFNVDESSKLIYLHGVVCETLRLFPPAAFNQRTPVQPDTLPSGHYVSPKTKVMLSFYSMARMETIWGNDCLDFKPERWISAQGRIKHEPSYKFVTFNAGPRACPGKDMALFQIKMIAATIICNYNIQVVEGHPVGPSDSLIIQMKHGFKVRLSKRNA